MMVHWSQAWMERTESLLAALLVARDLRSSLVSKLGMVKKEDRTRPLGGGEGGATD